MQIDEGDEQYWGSNYQQRTPLAKALIHVIAHVQLATELSRNSVTELTQAASEIVELTAHGDTSANSDAIRDLAVDAVMHTQFFDRQLQQVAHIVSALEHIAGLADTGTTMEQDKLEELIGLFDSMATMPEERSLVTAFLSGESLKQVIANLVSEFEKAKKNESALF